ncbi:MAG: hypothetical protein AMJ78_10340 [Omnitrophica WOR_2 bacterium SM23_29]|nr:MAG: hypothetical protein AMJ78_10340 [Omnitrophica WOR_2 bacterium SM23_29]
MVRVRFAPAPTGFLHIGSARTALFNWLFARHNRGAFILRIEDTDRIRSKAEYLDEICASLKWLGMNWDEDPYFQTKRLEAYRDYAQRLLKEDKAYQQEGKIGSEKAIILRMPKDTIKIIDLVHGPIEFDLSLQKDLVLMKSNGYPAYNFACVVDDYEMKITHVIRGDDHISNTPKQLALYRALEIEPPQFAHIPLILGTDRSRMSKRHGATSIFEYRKMGFLPEAMVNYISLLGWAPADNREMLLVDEIIKEFMLERVGKTPAVFDINKLTWMNGEHIKIKNTAELAELIIPRLKEKGYLGGAFDREWLLSVIKLLQGRIKTLEEFFAQADFFFVGKIKYEKQAVESVLAKGGVKARLNALIEKFNTLSSFDLQSIETCVRDLAAEFGIKAADLIHPIRVAVTGRTVGPGLFETVALLGKEKTIKCLKEALKKTK